MPRMGQNPMRWVESIREPAKITVTTAVHIPVLEGYWQQNLDVLKLCLQTVRGSEVPFELMVLDNGSCDEVQNYLYEMHTAQKIDYFICSQRNLGKLGAWNILFSSAPGEIVSYFDSDVFFLGEWLKPSLQILEAFPEAGMVTAQPIAGGDLSQQEFAAAILADPSISVETGKLIPDKYLHAHLKSIGAAEGEFERRQQNRKDMSITRNGVSAITTASHFQFTSPKKVLKQLLPFKVSGPLSSEQDVFDTPLVQKGYWRLSTTQYLVHHMGNTVPDFRDELPWLDTDYPIQLRPPARKPQPSARLLSNRHIRRFLQRINALTYRLLHDRLSE